jgi:hypothetical protein
MNTDFIKIIYNKNNSEYCHASQQIVQNDWSCGYFSEIIIIKTINKYGEQIWDTSFFPVIQHNSFNSS